MNEQRKHRRRSIVHLTSLFVTFPSLRLNRFALSDMSDGGLAFLVDNSFEETPQVLPFHTDQTVQFRFYFNEQLFFPLEGRVTRLEEREGLHKVAIELKQSLGYRGYLAFLTMLDEAMSSVRLDPKA